MTLDQLVLLIIDIILVMIVLYLAALIITGRKTVTAKYLINLFIVAVLAIFLLPIVGAIASMFFLSGVSPYIVFVALIYLIRYLLKPTKDQLVSWEKAIWISLIVVIFIEILNYITATFFGVTLIGIF